MSLPPLGPIKFLTIHCAATPEGRDVSAETINEWDKAKFGQTSYHYIILRDGTLVPNLDLKYKGAHTGGHNTGNIGICYVGGMDEHMHNAKDTRTPGQRQCLETFCRQMKAKYPGIVIKGHNEWPGVAKACPSFSVKDWLKERGI